jgi:hypothetical protein
MLPSSSSLASSMCLPPGKLPEKNNPDPMVINANGVQLAG